MSETTSVVDPRQQELLQLQREYRHMEVNRRQYADESQAVLRKQQAAIDKLRKDNDSVKADIAMIMRGTNKVLTVEQQEILAALNEQGDRYANQIEFEGKNILILEEQISIMREKELQQRKTMGGVNASKENYAMIQKQIKILENRLDKALIKFNESMQYNKKLRFEIDNLRRERIVFENIYRKMEKDLAEKKRQMAEVIEGSNQAYEQRDHYQMEVAAIEQANRKEQEEFEEQMQTLGRLLDTELQMPAPGASAAVFGASANTNGPSRQGSSHALGNGTSTGTLPQLKGSSSSQGRGSTNNLNGTRQSKSAGSLFANSANATGGANSKEEGSPGKPGMEPFEIDYRERAQNFEEAFNKIRTATGIQDIDELVKTFIQNEEHNFSLFNYVNEQNNEIEKLEEAIALLREEEMKYAQESGNDVNQHKEILKDLELKLLTTDNMAEKYELRCQDLSRIIESLKRGLQHIFALFFQENQWNSNDAGLNMLGSGSVKVEKDHSGTDGAPAGEPPVISEVNMVNYLAVLEKKTNELMQTYRNVQQTLTAGFTHDGGASSTTGTKTKGGVSIERQPLFVTVLGSGPKVPMGHDFVHVNPPKADDLYKYDSMQNAANAANNTSFGDEENGGTNVPMGHSGVDEEDEEETRPLTRDELKYRTLSRIQRRLASTGASTK